MTVTVKKSTANGKIKAPPSKSMAHRALICAALSNGKSYIKNIDYSNDITATINGLKNLGAEIEKVSDGVIVNGIDFNKDAVNEIDCFESGSTLRFLIPICLEFNNSVTLKGTKRLFLRSLGVYEDIFKDNGIIFSKTETSITVNGKLKAGEYSVPGDISSQFISGLMFVLPLKNGDSVIRITGKKESTPYIDMTVETLKTFGIVITENEPNSYFIKGNQKYTSSDIEIEGDYSNAAFFEALNYLGSNVTVCGLNKNSAQGDKVYLDIFKTLNSGYAEIDLADCPDLSLILMVLAAAKHGAKFINTYRLQLKESNRGVALADELKKFGAKIEVLQNEIMVKKSELFSPKETLKSHNDHRIVMALAVLLTVFGGTIENAEAVNKSFPNFFKEFKNLGIKVETDGA